MSDAKAAQFVKVALAFWAEALSGPAARGFGYMVRVAAIEDERWAELTEATVRATGGDIDMAFAVAQRAATLEPTVVTMNIFDSLVRGPARSWDLPRIGEAAVEVLSRSDHLRASPERARLETALLERGLL